MKVLLASILSLISGCICPKCDKCLPQPTICANCTEDVGGGADFILVPLPDYPEIPKTPEGYYLCEFCNQYVEDSTEYKYIHQQKHYFDRTEGDD